VREFRDLVKALHRAGIEVILDVVFNHTAEGNHLGPTFSFKGFDNAVYYLTSPQDRQYYADYSGCGNTLACNHPAVNKLVLDALTYWVTQMHVDGFRFDEGSALTRGDDGTPLPRPPVIWDIELTEDLMDTKVVAEAWDAAGLYQVGHFPGPRWAEWNGRFRDTLRDFVAGRPGILGDVATRLAGSADPYQANGEDDHDGINDNHSWNCGTEGPTDDPQIRQLRTRRVKNLLALTLLAQGVPMIGMGDEVHRTQQGNNNAYCQDNPLSWFDWTAPDQHADTLRFAQQLIAFRRQHPELHRPRYFDGHPNDHGVKDLTWHGCQLDAPGQDFTPPGIGPAITTPDYLASPRSVILLISTSNTQP
jgi:glycogen operon protein